MKKKFFSAMFVLVMGITIFGHLCVQASSTPSSWAANEVNEAMSANLVTDSVKNDYQANISREQFCEMVVRVYEKISGKNAEVGAISFNDTNNSEILKAANLGIVYGYDDDIFKPNDLITREQIAAMLVRMIDKAVSYVNVNVYNNNQFADNDIISNWALPSVNFAYDTEIMQGVGDNKIAPLDNTTCEQAILLVYRTFVKYYNEDAQLDSVYELSEEHIAQDDETYVNYTDNILLAFIKSGLSEDEKNDIADIVDGEVVAQLAGSINLLQIEVESGTLDTLNDMAEELMRDTNVYYAAPDVLINSDMIVDNSVNNVSSKKDSYAGEDEWWFKAIEADYVWNNYDKIIETNTVGVIECDGVLDSHEDLRDKISFISNEIEINNNQRDNKSKSHGTGVVGIITANRDNDLGITGVANKTNIVYDINKNELTSFTLQLTQSISNLIESGIKIINCSFGDYYITEEFFYTSKALEKYDTYADYKKRLKNPIILLQDKDISEDDFNEYKGHDFSRYSDYEDYRTYRDYMLKVTSRYLVSMTCGLITNNNDFLIIQAAGNGENNHFNNGVGVNTAYSGFWAFANEDNCSDIADMFNISYKDYKDKILIVGAVENKKNRNGNYYMTDFSDYGENVDLCAPGMRIRTCNSTGKNGDGESTWYDYFSGTSEAAPMVTGTAAVLWGINPTLTAAEVKDYIINGSKCNAIGVTGEDEGNEYPMLNVRGAVEELLKTKMVLVAVDDKDTNDSIQDAIVSYGNGLNKTTDTMGYCDIYFVDENHEITISKEGYKTKTVTVEDKYINQDGELPEVKKILLEKEQLPSHNSSVKKFNIVEEYNGKVYSGIEGGTAIHVGEPGEETAFCIYDNYIYYCPIEFSGIDWTFYDNFRLWRTDLDGNNKVSVLYVENNDDWNDTLTYTSLPIIIDNKIYFTVNQYDSDSEERLLGTTCVLDMDNPEFYENYGQIYWKRKGPDLHAEDKNAMQIIGANNNLLIYSPNDPYQWQPPFKNGITVYDLNSGIYSDISTDGKVYTCFADDNYIYIIIDDVTNKGTYRYTIDNGNMERVSEKRMSFVRNGEGYYVEDGSIYSLNMETLQTNEFLRRYGENYYNGVFDVTDEYIYLQNSGQTDNFNLCQINLKTKEERLISNCSYYN